MRIKAFAPIAIALHLAACATPAPMLTQSVGTIRTGLALADEQSDLVFASANQAARDSSIDRKLLLPDTNLREADFPKAIDEETLQRWDAAFRQLDGYLSLLQKLVDPSRAATTREELTAFGEQLSQIGANLPTGLAPAFANLGQAVVQIGAERKAQEVMARTNPAFQQVIDAMASAIGGEPREGLRGVVAVNLQNQVNEAAVLYGRLTPEQLPERRDAIRGYLAAVDRRDADLVRLASLRTSILALGEAHAAAAAGSPGSALFWIERISAWVEDTREAMEQEGKGDA